MLAHGGLGGAVMVEKDMASEALGLAMAAIDRARDCLMNGGWTEARMHLRDAIEDAVIAEKWETVDRFAR